MQELKTVEMAVNLIITNQSCSFNKKLALLHCVSAYPTPFQDVNLSMIELYKTLFPSIPIGYSGHELGISVSIAAVALGAKVSTSFQQTIQSI
jgi:sialic acid synthase